MPEQRPLYEKTSPLPPFKGGLGETTQADFRKDTSNLFRFWKNRTTVRGKPRIVGFTLLELIVVLSLLAVMAAAVTPIFRGTFARVQSDHAVRDFVATVKYAQERAVTDTQEYRLYFDQERNEYWLMRLARVDKAKKVFEPLKERQGERMILPERLVFDQIEARKDRELKAQYIAFFANGACDRGVVKLLRNDGHYVRIETKGSLGDLKVTDK